MPKKTGLDVQTRARIAGWVNAKKGDASAAALARRLGIHKGTMSRILNGTFVSLGLDVFIKIHRGLPIDANQILNDAPPRKPPPTGGRRASPYGQLLGPEVES